MLHSTIVLLIVDAVYHSNCSSYLISLQLLFPTADSARPFSMLGLGDIVIPGKFETFITCFVFLWSSHIVCNFASKDPKGSWMLAYSKSEGRIHCFCGTCTLHCLTAQKCIPYTFIEHLSNFWAPSSNEIRFSRTPCYQYHIVLLSHSLSTIC